MACPICSKNLAPYRVRFRELRDRGIAMFAIFHSPAEKMRRYFLPEDLPFTVIVDPEMTLYETFGVERDRTMWFKPRNLAALAGTLGGPVPIRPHRADRTLFTRPADFLIAPPGRVALVNDARHVDDSWTIEETAAAADALGLSAG